MFSAIGTLLGGIFGTNSTDQTSVNEQLQTQLDANAKKDKTNSIISIFGLIMAIIALIVALKKK